MHKYGAIKLALALAPLAMFAEQASAIPTFMTAGPRTTQPIGHYELCQQYPVECSQRTRQTSSVELTRPLWSKIVKINNDVNEQVAPRTDQEMWGIEERWSYPGAEGDCEDYVLEKRRRLMEIGMPAGSLLITVVRQRNGAGHAVLTVRTSLGDFILDNLESRVLDWTKTDYTYLKRQSDQNSGVWVSINDSRATAVGSVK